MLAITNELLELVFVYINLLTPSNLISLMVIPPILGPNRAASGGGWDRRANKGDRKAYTT